LIHLGIFLRLLQSHLHCLVFFTVIIIGATAEAIRFLTILSCFLADMLLDLRFFLFQHKFQSLALQVRVSFDHDFFKFIEVIDEQNLLDNLPLVFSSLCFFACLQELLLVDADILK
jgi:hypothetical protein